MPQVKIHVSSSIKEDIKEKLAWEVRKIVSKGFDINKNIGQAIVYESEYRGNHYTMSRDFILIEISTYENINSQQKKDLAQSIIDKVEVISGVSKNDINLVYYETPEGNCFGGIKQFI